MAQIQHAQQQVQIQTQAEVAQRRQEKEQQRQIRKEKMAEVTTTAKQSLASAIDASFREARTLPRRVDHLLHTVSGEENDILFWFLRIVTVTILVGVLFLMAWLLAQGVLVIIQ